MGDYMCIHVRRGDRITTNQIDLDTQPDNIMRIIKQQLNIKNIYIMTNKIHEIYSIKKINPEYIFHFYNDFDLLTAINDNYLLYSIETEIMKNATIRCSTFKIPRTTYYQHYLSETEGWQ